MRVVGVNTIPRGRDWRHQGRLAIREREFKCWIAPERRLASSSATPSFGRASLVTAIVRNAPRKPQALAEQRSELG